MTICTLSATVRRAFKDPKVWQNIFKNYDNSKPSWNSVLYAEVVVVSLAENIGPKARRSAEILFRSPLSKCLHGYGRTRHSDHRRNITAHQIELCSKWLNSQTVITRRQKQLSILYTALVTRRGNWKGRDFIWILFISSAKVQLEFRRTSPIMLHVNSTTLIYFAETKEKVVETVGKYPIESARTPACAIPEVSETETLASTLAK